MSEPEIPAARTIQQRVFDVIPGLPQEITLARLYSSLPYLDRYSIRLAIKILKRSQRIERVAGKAYTYRRIMGAARPGDNRGRPRLVLRDAAA